MAASVSWKDHFVHGRLKHPIGQFTPGAGAASNDGASVSSAAPARSVVLSLMNARLVRCICPPCERPRCGRRATGRVYSPGPRLAWPPRRSSRGRAESTDPSRAGRPRSWLTVCLKDGDREVEFLAKVPLGAIEVTSDAARGAYAAHLSFVAFIKDEAGRPVGGPGRFRAQGGTLPFEMATGSRGVRLSLDLDDPEGIPYFLWDEPMTLSV